MACGNHGRGSRRTSGTTGACSGPSGLPPTSLKVTVTLLHATEQLALDFSSLSGPWPLTTPTLGVCQCPFSAPSTNPQGSESVGPAWVVAIPEPFAWGGRVHRELMWLKEDKATLPRIRGGGGVVPRKDNELDP